MPVTRSQRQAAQRGEPGRGGRLNPLARPASPSSSEHPRLLRETESMDPFERAPGRSRHRFAIDRLQKEESASDSYFMFRFRPVSVRIRDPEGGPGRVECTCENFRNAFSPCVHIQWLHDALHGVLSNSPHASPTVEMSSRMSLLFPQIAEQQASIPAQINALDAGGTTSSSEASARQEIPEASNLSARTDVLCDLLSSFDGRQLPGEFRRGFAENAPAVTALEDCFVRGDLPATMYQIAMFDEAFFQALRKVVPRDHRATQYYEKQQARARGALQQFDLDRRAAFGVPRSLVPDCGRALRRIVHEMCQDRAARSARQPLGAAPAQRLAEILVLLIEDVCDHDEDIYEGRGDGQRPELDRNRNLFTYLISDPPRDAGAPRWMNDDFVVDRLRGHPSSEWAHMFEKMQSIMEYIHENAAAEDGGSLAYITKIDNMLREYTANADEPSSSAAQRRLMGP